MHDSPVVYSLGPYRVLAAPDAARPFVVVDGTGAWLRDELAFEDARAWIERRLAAPAAAPRVSRRARR